MLLPQSLVEPCRDVLGSFIYVSQARFFADHLGRVCEPKRLPEPIYGQAILETTMYAIYREI